MKLKQLLLPTIATALIAAGCEPKSNESVTSDSTNSPTSQQFERVKKDTSDAVQATRDYAYDQKAQFTENVRNELADLNKKMDELSAKIESSSETTKAEAKARLHALREKAESLNAQLDGLENTAESKWDETKSGVQKAWDDLKDSFDQARQWLSDKIAPSTPANK